MLMVSLRQGLTVCRQTQGSCLRDYGLVECYSTRNRDLSVHARIDFTGYVHLLWESIGEENEFSHAAIFEVKFGKKSERVITDSRGRFCAYCKMHQGNKKRQTGDQVQVFRDYDVVFVISIISKAVGAPYHVRQFFTIVLKKVQYYSVDVIAGDANAAACKYYKRQEYQDLYKLFGCPSC